MVSLERFQELTQLFFADKPEDAERAYKRFAGQFVHLQTFERLAGTEAFRRVPQDSAYHISSLEVDKRKADKTYYTPVELLVRWTHGEGKIVPHMMALDPDKSQQQAPPSLAFEGGKVQPDWLYQFLHNVQPLRPTLTIRMPSFWSNDANSYKTVYPAGRLASANPNRRPLGTAGEPLPGPDAPTSLQDDAQQVVEYFTAIAGEHPLGFQPVLVMDEANKQLYQEGYRLLFTPNKDSGSASYACATCHNFGSVNNLPVPKGPNLAIAKRRFKDEWLRRFLTFPGSVYPWTNMPANFYDWGQYREWLDKKHNFSDPVRGLAKGDEESLKKIADDLKAIKFYIQAFGEAESGTQPAPKP